MLCIAQRGDEKHASPILAKTSSSTRKFFFTDKIMNDGIVKPLFENESIEVI